MIVLLITVLLTFAAAYNQTQAINQVKFSVISHCTNPQIQAWNCTLCKTYPYLKQVSVVQNTAMKIKGFVGYDSKTNKIIVSWRGTDNNLNWIQDTDFKLIDFNCSNCKIHQGFYNAYYGVSAKTSEKVKLLADQYPTAQIALTGHSLGGALATVGTLLLYKQYPTRIKQLYVYGCPRVGNGALAAYLHSIVPKIYRVIHYKDLVPHLPPHDFQYLHPPYQIFYDEQMKNYVICNESGEDPSCSDGLAPSYSTSDHTLYWYKTDSSIC